MTPTMDMPATPPHSLEAERAVIGAVLLSDRTLPALLVDEGLRSDHFYRDRHAVVWTAILDLVDHGESVDVLTVTEKLRRQGQLEKAGGPAGVDELSAAVPAAGNARQYARIVIGHAEGRQILQAGHDLIRGVYDNDPETIATGERLLAQRSTRASHDTVTGDEWRNDVMAYFSADELPGWQFPWPKINELLTGRREGAGLRRGESTVIGAWTNIGKSPICDQILGNAGRQGARAHLYSNEGNRQQRALRNAARVSGVDLTRIQARTLDEQQMKRVLDALEQPLPFGYTSATGWTAEEIARDFRWRKYDVVAVDMFHYIPHSKPSELAGIEHNLDVLIDAAEIADCHLLLVVHFNEERAKSPILPVPVLRDIRGSGMIKNRCANVLFLHREQELDDASGAAVTLDDAALILAKVRYGETGGENGVFQGKLQRFIDHAGRA